MNSLVTGGAGFIGSNIVQLLLEKGDTVTVLDNLSSGSILNIENYIKSHDIRFIEADIRDATAVTEACRGQDVVFHLAASVGRQRSLDNPVLDSTINLIGTLNVLEGMKSNEVGRIVYSSSAAIFGELIHPAIDESHPQNADSPYGVSKLAAEKMIIAYSGIYNMTGICLRYFNVYGINQRFDPYGNVIPIFAKLIYNNQPITIYGDGTQTRDFMNVKDVAKVNYVGSVCDKGTDVYNIGTGNVITINELSEMMKHIAGSKIETIYAPERPADVKHCKADTAKTIQNLGFEAGIDLEQGVVEYMNWFKENCV